MFIFLGLAKKLYFPALLDLHVVFGFLLLSLFFSKSSLIALFFLLPSIHYTPPSSLFGSLTENLIEGLQSPEPSLLLPDLLTVAVPFSSSAEGATNGTSSFLVPCPATALKFLLCSVFLSCLSPPPFSFTCL